MTQLKKLAQGYQSQEGTGAGDLGDIDEDDEVPGRYAMMIARQKPYSFYL